VRRINPGFGVLLAVQARVQSGVGKSPCPYPALLPSLALHHSAAEPCAIRTVAVLRFKQRERGADLSALTMPHRHDVPAPALNSHSTRPASLDYAPSSQSSARTSARPLGSVAERDGRRRNRRSGPMTVGNAAAAFAMPAPRERARLAWPRRIRRRVIFRRVIGRRWVMGRRSVTPVVEGRRPSEHS